MPVPGSSSRSPSSRGRLLRRLWRALPAADRTAAIQAATRDGGPMLVQRLRLGLAKVMRMRPHTVQSWSAAQLAENSARVPLDEDVLADLLVALHLGERVPLLSAFLDAAGVPHANGVTEEGFSSDSVPPERVLAAADEVQQRFPALDCQVYFGTLLALEGGGWEPLRERLDESLLG